MSRHRWLSTVLLTGVVLSILLPLLWTLLASLGVQVTNSVSPPTWTLPPSLDSYFEIQGEQTFFWQELLTTILLSGLTTLLVIFVSFLTAYVLARTRWRFRGVIVQSCLILGSLPAISIAFPLSDILRYLHLYDTFPGVVLAETALFAPLAVYILHGYIGQLSTHLEESAYLEGAGLLTVLKDIVLPFISSGVIATGVIVFVLSWNQFFLPLLLTSIRVRVIPVMMRDFFALEREFEWTIAAAVLIVSLLPVSVAAAVAHQFLERFQFPALVDEG
jgi:multiple sugar transport system permease protein